MKTKMFSPVHAHLSFEFTSSNSTEAMNVARQMFERMGLMSRMYVEFNGEIIGQVSN